MTEPVVNAKVPCRSCNACCRVPTFFANLQPDRGDDASQYETVEITVTFPDKLEPSLALKKRPNGECVYLEDNKCSIYDRRPVTCREFDCRAYYRDQNSSRTIRQFLKAGVPGMSRVLVEARKRLGEP